jgi:ribosome-binding protein aMBF1 (putative translation factor)
MARSAPFRRSLKEELRDPEFAQEYEAELQRLRIAEQIAQARQAAGLSQTVLAERMGTSQPAVARLEHGDYRGYTLATLTRAARALGRRLKVELIPSAGPGLVYTKRATFGASAVKHAKKKVPRGGARKKK